MNLAVRLIAALALLAVAAFCAFGFLTTFESPGYLGWRVAYAVVGLTCLALAVGLTLSRAFTKPPDRR